MKKQYVDNLTCPSCLLCGGLNEDWMTTMAEVYEWFLNGRPKRDSTTPSCDLAKPVSLLQGYSHYDHTSASEMCPPSSGVDTCSSLDSLVQTTLFEGHYHLAKILLSVALKLLSELSRGFQEHFNYIKVSKYLKISKMLACCIV